MDGAEQFGDLGAVQDRQLGHVARCVRVQGGTLEQEIALRPVAPVWNEQALLHHLVQWPAVQQPQVVRGFIDFAQCMPGHATVNRNSRS